MDYGLEKTVCPTGSESIIHNCINVPSWGQVDLMTGMHPQINAGFFISFFEKKKVFMNKNAFFWSKIKERV